MEFSDLGGRGHYHHINDIEMVLPNGDVLRIGQRAVDGEPTVHVCKNNFCPPLDSLFCSATMELWHCSCLFGRALHGCECGR